MSAHAVLNDPPLAAFTNLHRELAPAVLEKCRELIAEYSALAKADPEAFPFTERDLLDWYGDMKTRVASMIEERSDRRNRVLPIARRTRRSALAA
jgi:hypothetical protein